jgi:hypothetical protein
MQLANFEEVSMRAFFVSVAAAMSLLFLVACDGGSGSNDDNNNARVPPVEPPVEPPLEPPVEPFCEGVVLSDEDPGYDSNPSSGRTGFLIDSAVSGLAYETPTHQGVTGLDGRFRYAKGETVSFMLGDTLLGEVIGQPQVTPFDLAGSPVITQTVNILKALEDENSPFRGVVNIAVLLQSLDRDADPENGIRISPDVASLFHGVHLDFKQSWEAFLEGFTLRHAIGQANSECFFSAAHGLTNPAFAVQHLYSTQGIDADTHALTLEQIDPEGDGLPNRSWNWQYDTNGNVISTEIDDDGDGSPDFITTSQYDANGNLTRLERDPFEGIVNWQYDPFNNPTRVERDENRDGAPDQVWEANYNVDSNVTRTDTHNDGGVNTVRYLYTESGKLKKTESGSNGDGIPSETESYFYDAKDNLVRREWDENADGILDRIESYEYDARENLVLREEDVSADGIPNNVWIWQYDNQDTLRVHEWWEDYGDDGMLDRATLDEYDDHGNRTRRIEDNNGDGVPEQISLALYNYDADGKVLRVEFDENGDGTPDRIESYEYDARGNVTRLEVGEGTPENIVETIQYRYDAKGNQTEAESDFNGDGISDRLEFFEYDGDGHVIGGGTDENLEGTITDIHTFEFQPAGWGHIFHSDRAIDPFDDGEGDGEGF